MISKALPAPATETDRASEQDLTIRQGSAELSDRDLEQVSGGLHITKKIDKASPKLMM
jgi:type VI protein secretion system component Hcp